MIDAAVKVITCSHNRTRKRTHVNVSAYKYRAYVHAGALTDEERFLSKKKDDDAWSS